MQIGLGIGIGHNSRKADWAAPYVGPYSSLVTAPVIAAGFKRLHAGYTGSLIHLLRADDDADMAFGYDANGDLPLDDIATWGGASALLGMRWYNQYTAGEDYVQATKASMPTFNATGLNGGPCFVFDGGNDYFTMSRASAITGTDIFAAFLGEMTGHVNNVGWLNGYQNGQAADNANGGFTMNCGAASGRLAFEDNGNGIFATGVPTGTPFVGASRQMSTDRFVNVNGGTEATGVTSGSFTANRFQLGARWYSSAASFYLNGKIAGATIFGADPGTMDRGVIIDYLKSVGGVA